MVLKEEVMKSFSLKNIKGLILYTIVILFAFIYIKDIINILGYIIKLFMPFIIGLGVAFVLNVLVNVVEKKWLKNWKASAMTKRACSLIVALTMVIGFFVFLLFLIIPNLQNTIAIFADNIPAYTKNLQELLNSLGIDTNIITLIGIDETSVDYNNNNFVNEPVFEPNTCLQNIGKGNKCKLSIKMNNTPTEGSAGSIKLKFIYNNDDKATTYKYHKLNFTYNNNPA